MTFIVCLNHAFLSVAFQCWWSFDFLYLDFSNLSLLKVTTWCNRSSRKSFRKCKARMSCYRTDWSFIAYCVWENRCGKYSSHAWWCRWLSHIWIILAVALPTTVILHNTCWLWPPCVADADVIFLLLYQQYCAKRNAPVFHLLRGRFSGFSPRRGDTLHRLGWNLANFTPVGATVTV